MKYLHKSSHHAINAVIALLMLTIPFSCSRKADDRHPNTYSDVEISEIRSKFDSCETIIGSFRARSVNIHNADSILDAVNVILELPGEALTHEQIEKKARHYVTASSVYILKNEVGNAFRILEKGMSLYSDQQYRNEYCDISTAMTILFFNYAMYDQADEYADYNIEAAKIINDSLKLCTAYTNKSWIADRVRGRNKDTAYHYVALARQWRPKNNFVLDYILESYAGHIYVTDKDSAAVGIRYSQLRCAVP